MEQNFSLTRYFRPFTTIKALHFIVIIGILVFFNSLFNPFILDDLPQIVSNPQVHQLSSIPSLFFTSLSFPGASLLTFLHMYYKPLLFTVYALLYVPFGGVVFPFHLLQMLLHIANTLLLFHIFSRIFKRRIAFLLSLVFLVHPLNSEAVIYIANIQDVLFVFFGLLAFSLVMKRGKTTLALPRLIVAGILLLCSLLSKETGVLFLAILFSYAWMFARSNVTRVTGVIATVITIYVGLRFVASLHASPVMTLSMMQHMPLAIRMLSIPKIIFHYIATFLFPVHLATGQEWLVRRMDMGSFFLPLLADSIFCTLLILCEVFIFQKNRKLFSYFFFFTLWFCLGLGMHIQLLPLDLTVADRWFYFPIIGLLGMGGVFLTAFPIPHIKNISLRVLTTSLLSILLFSLSLLTIMRNAQWSSLQQLYGHDVQYAGNSPVLYSYYGGLLMQNGRYNDAKWYLEKSVSLDPSIGSNLDNLAMWYEHNKEYQHAEDLYRQNIRTDTTHSTYEAQSYEGLARITLLNGGNPRAAKQIAETGLRKYPTDTLLLEYLAVSEYQLGEKKEALQVIQKAYDLAPDAQNRNLYELIASDRLSIHEK